MLTRVKSKIEMRGPVMGKLRQDLNRLQNDQAIGADQIRKLEIEKIALEMDNEVLKREKEELQKQLVAAGKREIGGESVSD